MLNLSQIKRKRMLEFLDKIKEEHINDDEMLIALGEIENELNSKKYGLVWEEHEEQVDVQMRTHIPVFTEITEREIAVAPEKPYNFLLEGDNLHSLYLLEKTHKGKIDVIYIDPPYNTKNKDFVYDDCFIGEDDAYRHSKWLSFMINRLIIARKLLSKKGVIFISIDDNELSTLHLLCDQVFGEKNFIGQFHWLKSKTPPNLSKKIKKQLEYILCYEKNKDNIEYEGVQKSSKSDDPFTKPQNSIKQLKFPAGSITVCIPDGIYKAGIYGTKTFPNKMINDMIVVNGRNKNDVIFENKFIWTQDTLEKNIEGGVEIFIRAKSLVLSYKRQNYGKDIPSNLIDLTVGADTTENASKKLIELLGKKCFDYPKDVGLLKYLLSFKKFDSPTILDFFAGSGTTGQAVLELNKEDGGNRKFILCTNNESQICDNVTYPRIKTIITGKRADGSTYSDGIPANLKYYRTDFVSKNEEMLSDALLEHIKEMVQLEHMVKIDGKNYVLLLDDESADCLEDKWNDFTDLKGIYISKNVLLTSSQNELFNSVEMKVIPDYYFNFELKEVGETW